MARLKRAQTASKTKSSDSTPKQSNPTLLLGLLLFVGVALLTFVFTTSLQSKATVLVASKPIPAYTTVDPARMLKEQQVPKDSVGEYDLTPDSLEEQVKNGKALVTRVEVQVGQRVDQRVMDASGTALAAVKDDERVVAVNTTYSGIVGGAVIPGSVVDIYSTGGGAVSGSEGNEETGAVAESVKVLGVGTGGAAAQALRSEAGSANVKNEEGNGGGGSGDIVVLLSVPSDQVAGIVASGTVVLSLNPHFSFEPNGELCAIGECTGGQPAPADESTGETTPDATATPEGEDTGAESELPQSPVEEETPSANEER